MLLYLKGSPSWKFVMKPETRESPVCCCQQSREQKATETTEPLKEKEYCGSRTVSASILSEKKVHVKAAKWETKGGKKGGGGGREVVKFDKRK